MFCIDIFEGQTEEDTQCMSAAADRMSPLINRANEGLSLCTTQTTPVYGVALIPLAIRYVDVPNTHLKFVQTQIRAQIQANLL